MKWFFALNEASSSFDNYSKMLRVAVYTAYKYTELEPFFIYDGAENELTQWLRSKGVKIIFHRVSIYNELKSLDDQNNSNYLISTGSGAFQRIDIPLIVKENGWNDKYVLYSDCDIMFWGETNFDIINCKYFAVAPEIIIDDYVNMNSGVMVMNIPNLFPSVDGFHRFVKQNLLQLSSRDWDQTAYRSYYHLEWDKLDTIYNWKPYWGMNSDAKIIHFHGPKPTSENEVLVGIINGRPKELADQAGDVYFRLVDSWKQYLEESNQPFSFEKYKTSWTGYNQLPSNSIDLSLDKVKSQTISETDLAFKSSDCDDWRALKGSLILKIMLDKNDLTSILDVCNLFEITKDYEAELFHLSLAHKLAPDSAVIATRIGSNLYNRGDIPSAIKSFEYAHHLLPNDDSILVSLGKLCFEMKFYQDAQNYLLKALQINPASVEVLAGLKIVSHYCV